MINLKKRDNKYYISLAQLKAMGFELPEKGAEVFTVSGYFNENWETYLKFHEVREGWPGVYLSPYLSDIGKIYRDSNFVYLELTPKFFQYKPVS